MMYTILKNNNRVLISSDNDDTRAVQLEKIDYTRYLHPTYFELDLERVNVPDRLFNEFVMLEKFAKSIKSIVYVNTRDSGLFVIKKKSNLSLYGGYKGEIPPRIKFTKTPRNNIETLFKRFNLGVEIFEEIPLENVRFDGTYFKEQIATKTTFFYFACQLADIFESANVQYEEFIGNKAHFIVRSKHHAFRLILKYKPYKSKKETQ